jgi:hypothetical protein
VIGSWDSYSETLDSFGGPPAGLAVDVEHVLDRLRDPHVMATQDSFDYHTDIDPADLTLEERGHRDLVGAVQGGGGATTGATSVVGQI